MKKKAIKKHNQGSPELEAEILRLRMKIQALEEQHLVDSWNGCVDTASGASTQWEIDNASKW